MVINNIECFIKIYLLKLLPDLLNFYEEIMRKKSFIFLFWCKDLNVLEILERFGVIFRVKVLDIINPSQFFTADVTYASLTEAFWPSSQIQNISKLEFVPP